MLCDITGEGLLSITVKTTFIDIAPQPDTPIGGLLDYNFIVKICAAGRYNPVNTRRRPDAGLTTARRR